MSDLNENEDLLELAAMARLRAAQEEHGDERRTYSHSDFVFDVQQDAFWCLPTSSLHSAAAVNAMVPMDTWRIPLRENPNGRPPSPIPPARDIARIESGAVVEGSTWLPGRGKIINDLYVSNEGFFPLEGARTYNTFRPAPKIEVEPGFDAGPWLRHIEKLWPEKEEREFFLNYCAHMVQKPHEKCNGAIVLSGKQGIGKDAALFPLRFCVGDWNCRNISPDAILSRFNPWVETLMLIVDEVRPMSDDHRATSLYDALKTLSASPPNVLPMEDKGQKVRFVANCLRIFMTTNDRLALYIPPEDRRILVLHSPLPQLWHEKEGKPEYFVELFNWLENGGNRAVAMFLASRDISTFNPKGNVPKTAAWAQIGERWAAPEDELTQALEYLDYPDAVFSTELLEGQFDGVEELRRMMKGRGFVFRMQQAGYELVPLENGLTAWTKEIGGYKFKSNKAYVKEGVCRSIEEARLLVKERLLRRVEAGSAGLGKPLRVVK